MIVDFQDFLELKDFGAYLVWMAETAAQGEMVKRETLDCQVPRDQEDHLEDLESLDPLEYMVFQVYLDLKVYLVIVDQLDQLVQWVLQETRDWVCQDQKECLDHQGNQVTPVSVDYPVVMDHLVQTVFLDCPDQLETLDFLDRKGILARRVNLLRMDNQDHEVTSVNLEYPACPGNLVSMAHQEILVHLVKKEILDLLEEKVILVCQEIPDWMA